MKIKIFSKFAWLIMLLSVSCINTLYAQQQMTATGKVVDEQNAPIIGVSVVGKDGTGTITDVEGNFNLRATAGDKLTFSYIGYVTATYAAASNMQVVLKEDAILLDAVTIVGVGYGTMRKQDLTGSITSVSADKLKKGVVTSAEQMLQGKVAGLTVVQPSGDPTTGSSLRLRGGTSLSAGNSPLIVVDGIAGVDINTIQPNDIISIDVLKDASASAIYGSRGANGVIIVTTNREQQQSFSMSYDGFMAVSSAAKNLDLLSADQWRAYVRENNMGGAVDYGGDTDWQKELQRTSVSHSHTLSFSNGNERGGYRATLSFKDIQGVIKESSLSRLAGSLSGYQYGLNNRLKLEAGIHVNRDEYNPIDMGIFERAYNLNPTLPVKQNGEYTQIGGTNNNNPVELLENPTNDQSRVRMLAYGKAELQIIEGLKGVVNASYEYNTQQGRYYLPSDAYNGQTDRGTGTRSLGDYNNYQLETYLTYDKTFADIHRLNVMAGYSYLENMYEGFGASRRGFDTDLFLYNNLAAGTDYRMGDVYSYKGEAKLISFFGRVNYVLRDHYMFTGTLRRDGSSRFGDNHKWGLFPSASLAWRISEEDFMAGSRGWLDNLKLRAGFGVTGNQDGIGEYKSLSLMGTGSGAYYDQATESWKQAYGITQNPNPDLKWESTAQFNFGIDFAFLHRFNVTIDAYYKKTSDLLYTYDVPQPPYLYDKMMANVGDLSNKGIELTVSAKVMETKDFTWNANLTLAHNKQEVEKLSNDIYQTDVVYSGSLHDLTGMSGVYTQILKEGYAVGSFWGPKCIGVDENGKFIFANDGESQYLGNAQPKLTMGLAMDFTYRDFDLNISGYGMFGQKILNAQAMNISYPGRMPGYNILDDFRGSNLSENIYSSYWIENGSFFRIQSITLGYTLPVKNNWFKKIRVYAIGENLFTFTGYNGIDPEVNISGLKSPGIDKSVGSSDWSDNYYYPRARTFSIGLNLSF